MQLIARSIRLFRMGEGSWVGAAMGDLLGRAEHYRKQAETYHELAKFAQPAYLGDFYRGVAVRYVFMSQELCKQAEKDVGSPEEPLPVGANDDEPPTHLAQDLDLLAVWAGERSRSGEPK
jgi:hypothetical protein